MGYNRSVRLTDLRSDYHKTREFLLRPIPLLMVSGSDLHQLKRKVNVKILQNLIEILLERHDRSWVRRFVFPKDIAEPKPRNGSPIVDCHWVMLILIKFSSFRFYWLVAEMLDV